MPTQNSVLATLTIALARAAFTLAELLVLRHGFDRVYPFTRRRAVFRSGNKYGYIDRTGKAVIPATWSFARPFNGPLAAVVDGRASAYVDVNGKVVWRSER